jgi:CheY-like chemotaxis protein
MLAKEQQEILKDIEQSAASAARLTGQLLAFARRQSVAPEVLDAGQLVAETVEMIRRMLGRTITVRVMAEDAGCAVRVDRSQFENALLNLAVNARDAMPDGGRLSIEVYATVLEESYVRDHAGAVAGPQVVVAVTDTGTGMMPETARQAFEPFFTTKPRGKGTGLGLAQVYSFARQSGGHAELASVLGQGTRVTIYLPRETSAEATPAAPAAPVAAPQGGSETELVVDDRDSVRDFAAAALRRAGYRALTVESAEDALEVLAVEPDVALLVTDIAMPGMNGRELAEAVSKRWQAMKILLVTGEPGMVTRLDDRFGLMSKPFTGAQLQRKARQMLDAAADTDSKPAQPD